jgi:N-acetylneuraminic acid mutarotase
MWSKTIVLAFVVLPVACSKNQAVKPDTHLPGIESGNSSAPLTTQKFPPDQKSEVPANTKILVSFNVDIDPATLLPTNFFLMQAGNETAVSGTVRYDAGTRTAEFVSESRLTAGVAYTAQLSAAIKDVKGNSLAQAEQWSFTTRPQGWTWVAGASEADVVGTYGSVGVADGANFPGARDRANSWIDSKGKIFVANGYAGSLAGPGDSYNDLWQWDGTNWTWLKGNIFPNQMGDYGTIGVAASSNVISARHYAADAQSGDNHFVFGGYSYDNAGGTNYGNDLWKWDGTNWTWISGSNTVSQPSVHGTLGAPDPLNHPGARAMASAVADKNGNVWIFGGSACDEACAIKSANVLWKWDGTNWTWLSGGKVGNESGVYGMKGTADLANVPGARQSASTWLDAAGNLWLFGGYGYDSAGVVGNLNDLWKWDGSQWTWVAGGNSKSEVANYGIRGKAADTNTPGPRSSDGKNVAIDSRGHVWIYGGYEIDGQNGHVPLNDLWEWDGASWTWISGSETPLADGSYGTKGIFAGTNVPSARNASVMIDADDSIWIFGGRGKDAAGTIGNLSDLWKFNP